MAGRTGQRAVQWATAGIVALLAGLLPAPKVQAEDTADAGGLSYADLDALTQLSIARNALAELPQLDSPLERRIRCSTAVTALTALYQLYGCAWALPALQRVYAHPDCPPLIVGYSLDGRLELRIEPLELKRPEFAEYSVLLVTLSSLTALDLAGEDTARLELQLADDSTVSAQLIDARHPLWPRLERLATSFETPPQLLHGTATGFKQVFSVSAAIPAVSAVSLRWGKYWLEIPNYGYQEGL